MRTHTREKIKITLQDKIKQQEKRKTNIIIDNPLCTYSSEPMCQN